MNFRIVDDIDAFESPSFTYLANDFSIVSNLDHSQACGGFLVNDIAIEIDANGTPLAVGGYCPSFDWVRGGLEIPRMRRKKIRILPDDSIHPEPGAYRSLSGDTPWPVHMDFFSKALCIGYPVSNAGAIEFLPGAAFVMDGDKVAALWLLGVSGLADAQ